MSAIHATFLDPFAGYTTVNRLVYGHHANWSDNYFTRDRTTKYTTNSKLIYSHNVDVTPLDPDYSGGSLLCFYSDSIMPVSTPVITSGALQDSDHSWPHDFYASTITNGVPNSEGYGFPLSKEAGNWHNIDGYERGNNPTILGSSTLACLPDTELDMTIGAPIDFPSLFHASSTAGVTVLPSGLYLSRTSSTPLLLAQDLLDINPPAVTANTVWFSAAVNVTGTVNFVSCDIAFTSPDAAQGLLTVFWETNAIGSVDERTMMAEGENYRFPLPENYSSGTYALGFRLDSFTNITSNVTVTNVAAGFAGNTAPMSLDISNMTDGVFMTLSGPSLHNYLVEASTNLVDWAPFAILANTNGAVRFNDPDAASYSKRFYRAVMP